MSKGNYRKPDNRGNKREEGYSPSGYNDNSGRGVTQWGMNGKPAGEGEVKTHISVKSLKDMPKSSYALWADPMEAMVPGSAPYPFLAAFNPVTNADFAGEDNLDGGNVQQYSNSVVSKFLHYFDCARLKLNVNYRYLPVKPWKDKQVKYGTELINEMRKSIAESVSLLQSTTFTQLQINNFAVITDLPMGSAVSVDVANGDKPIMAYTNITDVLYSMSIYYQTLLQEINTTFLWHNSFRMKQGTMIRNAWNREVPALNALFGLYNKSSFLNLLKSISLSFEGEYFDKKFADQIADACFIPSRRSNALTDPVLEIQPGFNHPSQFIVVQLVNGKLISKTDSIADSTIFDDAALKYKDPEDDTKEISIWEVCSKIRDILSLQATTLWARRVYASGGDIVTSDTKRFNTTERLFKYVTQAFTYMKPRWADFRECFDTMSRTGTLTWQTQYTPQITKKTDMILFKNMVVNNIYNSLVGGATELSFDTVTKRWRGWAKWDMYDGIPAYDLVQGGFFIAASCKTLSGDTDNEETPYIPVAFTIWENTDGVIFLTSRDGYEAAVGYSEEVMDSTRVLSRLVPLPSQADLMMRVPTLKWASNSTLLQEHRDTLYKTLCTLFGVCKIYYAQNQSDYAVDPDLLAIYQIEYNDITNVAITYARANAPFRGTESREGILGFWGLQRGSSEQKK